MGLIRNPSKRPQAGVAMVSTLTARLRVLAQT